MKLFLILVLVSLMIAVFAVLVAGLVNLSKTGTGDDAEEGDGPSPRALRSNKLMWSRIYLQFGAIAVAAILLMLASAGS